MESVVVDNVMRTRKVFALGLVIVAALVAVMLVLSVPTRPAEAAFPGSNGQIVFHSARSIVVGDPSTTDTEIFMMNSNGTGLTQLTVNAAQDFNPAWSPDGTQIAFHSDRDGNGEIYTMNTNGTSQQNRTSSPAHESNPDWQPGP